MEFHRLDLREDTDLTWLSIQFLRVGGGISSELINGESFALKLSSDYGKTHYKAAVNSQFDENFQNMDSQLQFNSSGQNAKTYNSNLKVELKLKLKETACSTQPQWCFEAFRVYIEPVSTTKVAN